ncbi:hypothetical protein ACGFYF_05420 [Streptomyces lavendulae]
MPPTWRVLAEAGYFAGLSAAIGTTAVTYAAAARPPGTQERAALRRVR